MMIMKIPPPPREEWWHLVWPDFLNHHQSPAPFGPPLLYEPTVKPSIARQARNIGAKQMHLKKRK